jgi:3alpha(or 20beta)-hydroxysteroid dehydrogenase
VTGGAGGGAAGPGRAAGKVVVVTGAGRGQGAAEARLLAAEGATVVAADLGPEPAEALPGVEYRQLDVVDATGWAALAAELRDRFGRVDGLVANAGITWRARLSELDPADLARVSEVNVTGTLLGVQALTPLMPGGGSIVVVGSVAALTGHYPVAYTASKWALRGLAKAACLELGPRGIRINTVHPGYIETPMTASASPAFRDANIAETPLGRTGSVDEIAPLVLFLISDESSFPTGAEIPVDGGLTAHGGVKSISDAVRP